MAFHIYSLQIRANASNLAHCCLSSPQPTKKKAGLFGPLHGHIYLPKFLLIPLIVFVVLLADLYLSYGLPLLLAVVRLALMNGVERCLLIGVHFGVFYALAEFHGFVD